MARGRTVQKVGVATTDWSQTVLDQRWYPAMGGAGWARLGQLGFPSAHAWVYGTLINGPGAFTVRTWDSSLHPDCNVLVLQRYMDADVTDGVRAATARGQIVINDLDDWFWGLHPDNAAYAMTDPGTNKRSNVDHYRETLLASSAVVVSTPYLAERVREWAPDLRIEVIPNGITVNQFPTRRQRHVDPVIGWTGSTAHRSGDLTLLRKPFAALPDARFHHTGFHLAHPSFADEVGVPVDRISALPMLAPHEYPYGFTFDIGVVPLVDIPFNHAKSNIKGLEYAAAGVPFVASPLPEYVRLAEEHGIGRLAKTARDWVRELTALMDYDARADEARRQRKAVATLSTRAQARAWDRLIWDLT